MADLFTQEDVLSRYLTLLQRDVAQVQTYAVLQEGMSGASTFRVRFSDGETVLKVTLSRAGPVALERARREVLFYRELADAVPLCVPQVLGTYHGPDGVALLFAAYEPSPPPERWNESAFHEVARQLAQFHAAFWNQWERLSRFPWLPSRRPEVVRRDIQRAHRSWQRIWDQPQVAGVFDSQADEWIRRRLALMPTVVKIIGSLAPTLCHGDCIPTNVLRSAEGHLIWTDWQEVRRARGPEDLSFFLQRAVHAGAVVSPERMIATYQETLSTMIDDTPSLKSVQQVIDAAELQSRVLEWPPYLLGVSVDELKAMAQRIDELAEKLQAAP